MVAARFGHGRKQRQLSRPVQLASKIAVYRVRKGGVACLLQPPDRRNGFALLETLAVRRGRRRITDIQRPAADALRRQLPVEGRAVGCRPPVKGWCVAGAAGPAANGAEVCDCAVARGGADVGEERFGDVQGAENVGVEGVVVFFGAVMALILGLRTCDVNFKLTMFLPQRR